jgi:hypothetical protein
MDEGVDYLVFTNFGHKGVHSKKVAHWLQVATLIHTPNLIVRLK